MNDLVLHQLAVEYAKHRLSQTDKQSTDEQLKEYVAAYQDALQKIPLIDAKPQPQRTAGAMLNQH
jgi:hypothetical protein